MKNKDFSNLLTALVILWIVSIVLGLILLRYDAEPKNDIDNIGVVESEPFIVEEAEDPFTWLGKFKITAYCPCSKCCGQWADGITSTGVTASEGRTIAVDPKVIPYGSKVVIAGNEYIAEDCGGAIKENRIDIYFESHDDALEYGVQTHDVYIIN